jgi:site-specific DNA-cytosine methylase
LLKQQSVLRNSKTRGTAREEIASDVEGRVGECRNNPEQLVAGTLGAGDGNRGWRNDLDQGAFIPVMSMDEECNPGIEMIGPIIRGGGGGRHDCVAVPYTKAKRAQSDTDDETWVEGQVNPTLSLFDCGDVRATTVAIQGNLIGRDKGGPQGVGASTEGAMYTMTKADVHGVAQAMTVRRLTPRECERLQGFPDDYTLIPWRKKAAGDCPDGPRYKALGNSMAVNVVTWIGERIQSVDAQTRFQSAPPMDNGGDHNAASPL